MKRLFNIFSFISNHPIAGRNKFSAYKRFLNWQIIQTILPKPCVCKFVEDSVLLIEKGMRGATGNIYCGLLEFEDMAFVLHFLRPGDLMGDIGANVGAYTVLAAKNSGANVVSIEPVSEAFQHLEKNVHLNNIVHLTTLLNCGAASKNGELEFTQELDVVNHVATSVETKINNKIIKVKVRTLDEIFQEKEPLLLKIDVEGFELEVIKGALKMIHSDNLKAIIIELNGSGMRYGFSDESIHNELMDGGFAPYIYDPYLRKIIPLDKPGNLNTLYLKNTQWVMNRISSAKKFSILDQQI